MRCPSDCFTNVLTFKGKISSSASDKLKITGLNGTIKDLAGNLFSCPWTEDTPKELSTTLSNDYVWSLSDFRFLSANTYEIASKLDLRHLAFLVNVNNNDCNGITFKQTQNITCDDTYTPIGGYIDQVNKMFGGTYDGQEYTVSGITVSRTGDTWADCYLGLFGFVGNGGIVKNVVLASSTFTGHDYAHDDVHAHDGAHDNGRDSDHVLGPVAYCLLPLVCCLDDVFP